MEYMGNKAYWDKKFNERGDNPLQPEQSLVDNIKHLKSGSVLDIASGDGRNSLFLLSKGFEVTAVDFSSAALKRLSIFSNKYNYSIKTHEIDLSNIDALNSIGLFDNIIINHYRLNKFQLLLLKNHLTKNGVLFICGFGHKHIPDNKIRKDDLIMPNDFDEMKKDFDLVNYTEHKDTRGFFVTYLFKLK